MLDLVIFFLELLAICLIIGLPICWWNEKRLKAEWRKYRRLHFPGLTNEEAIKAMHKQMPKDWYGRDIEW